MDPAEQVKHAPRMISSRAPDASMLAAIGISPSDPNAKMAQLYDEDQAVAVIYENAPEIEYVFIPYEGRDDKVGAFPFYKGEYFPFKADLVKIEEKVIQVVTEAGIATYTREGQYLKEVDFVRMADVMTADEIKEMRMQRRTDTGVDEAISYYLQCMDDVLEAGAWFCDGCGTGKLMFSIGCFTFNPCNYGANVTCITLAILNHFR